MFSFRHFLTIVSLSIQVLPHALAAKPGECPASPPGLITPCLAECVDDYGCAEDKKCCPWGCGIRCSEPASEPPVLPACPVIPDPPTHFCIRKDDERCNDTIPCPIGESCCATMCGGTSCLARDGSTPQPVTCPKLPNPFPRCFRKDDERCSVKYPCAIGQSCCPTQCLGTKCYGPEGKEGVCPVPPPGIFTPCIALCEDDSKCPGTEKCCHWGCGIRCLEPVEKEKSGKCPVPPKDLITTCDVQCTADSECPDADKCCNWGCSRRCLGAGKPPQPPICPALPDPLPQCFVKDEERCNATQPCPYNQNCCPTECLGTKCNPGPKAETQPPVCPPVSPPPKGVCNFLGVMKCGPNQPCGPGETCCETTCGGRACTTGKPPQPPICPALPDPLPQCFVKDEERCNATKPCPYNQNCCPTECLGTKCNSGPKAKYPAPSSPSPPRCPALPDPLPHCIRKDDERCNNDTYPCQTGQVCCPTICLGTMCHPRQVRTKPPTCPALPDPLPQCFVIDEERCNPTYPCPYNQICCPTQCQGTECTPIKIEKEGECPVPPPGLFTTCDVQCEQDSDCPRYQKCCHWGCSIRCLLPH